uniref:Alternative protein RASL10A n=1 Tax=Homo sapiens TaxID=9606 RepID=L8E9A0_HUMAN|nr:alternative protein RASL10A [Homo sapiens]
MNLTGNTQPAPGASLDIFFMPHLPRDNKRENNLKKKKKKKKK